MVTVSKNGPYLITEGIDLMGDNIQWAEGASKEHYTLCRCGASTICLFVTACIEQLVSGMRKTEFIRKLTDLT
ncbi:MAG TPA: hypothetical protein VGW09_10800, partial [Nitrososphaeraceae archaeon]|nr:hypothetical protein [Nitrososphaeraceae archaeon]